MEDGLVWCSSCDESKRMVVLILIVVEDGLVPIAVSFLSLMVRSLNPYCSGRWSRTMRGIAASKAVVAVLILIVVEDGLVLGLEKMYKADLGES